jgi:hypothetical protein
MEFINEFGFDVKRGEVSAFQEWIRAHEKELAAEAPPGWQYVGTYAVVMGSEKQAGEFRQLWRHDSYGAMDAWAAAMREGGRFAELQDEIASRFVDQDKSAHWSQTIMKAVADASFWGEG